MREKATMLIECLQAAKTDDQGGDNGGQNEPEESQQQEEEEEKLTLKGAETLEEIGPEEGCRHVEQRSQDDDHNNSKGEAAPQEEELIMKTEDPQSRRSWRSTETFCKQPSYSVIDPPKTTMDGTAEFREGVQPESPEEAQSRKRTCELRKEIEGLDKEIGDLQDSFSRTVLKE